LELIIKITDMGILRQSKSYNVITEKSPCPLPYLQVDEWFPNKS